VKHLALAALAACTPIDSDAVTTANLRADVQVIADGTDTTAVYAWLFSHKDGDPPLNFETIRLVEADSLSATSNGSSVAMRESDLVVEYRYDAMFGAAAPEQTFEVALDRATDTSAPHSSVSLPAPFAPTIPTTSSRSAPLTITWSPSGTTDPVSIHVSGCASAQLDGLADSGAATLPAGTIVADQAGETCDVSVEITRSRSGMLDPAYGQGGSITAEQQRTVAMTTSP
jgi:hypothetical protein